MQPPVERAPGRWHGTAGDAALVVAIGAVAAGAVAAVLALLWLLPVVRQPTGEPWTGAAWLLAPFAPAAALVSWVLAVASVWTAAVARRTDRRDRRARLALRVAMPGALAGAVAVGCVLVVVLVTS